MSCYNNNNNINDTNNHTGSGRRAAPPPRWGKLLLFCGQVSLVHDYTCALEPQKVEGASAPRVLHIQRELRPLVLFEKQNDNDNNNNDNNNDDDNVDIHRNSIW